LLSTPAATATSREPSGRFGHTLIGNGAANRLNGRDGADTLTGGGNDIFRNDVGGPADTITDFIRGQYKMEVFVPYVPTVFVSSDNPTAPNDDTTILYDTDTGEVFYDEDGVGAAVAQHIFTLDNKLLVLTVTDFIFV
jgi:Ca2+-binding RTX toxin-like protein